MHCLSRASEGWGRRAARFGRGCGPVPKTQGVGDALVLADLPNGRIVGRLGAHKKLREERRRLFCQQLLQNRRGQFASAASAMGQFRKAKGPRAPGNVVHRDLLLLAEIKALAGFER
jgi:hypothetical protein